MSDVILQQLPGDLPLEMAVGNDFSFKVDWASDTSLFTFTGIIEPVGSVKTPINMTVTPISAVLGTYTITISKSSITGLPLNVKHTWKLNRVGPSPALLTRTVLAGRFTVLDK